MRTVVAPDERYAPLTVDTDRMLACAIASQQFKAIAGGNAEVVQVFGTVDRQQLTARGIGKRRAHAPGPSTREHKRGRFVAETLDHMNTYYVKR